MWVWLRLGWASGAWRVFLSTFEKQLDGKRRIVVPQEFRALTAGPFDGVFCFPSIEADCIEGGGKALFDRYQGLIEELPFGDPVRSALETSIFGGVHLITGVNQCFGVELANQRLVLHHKYVVERTGLKLKG